MFDDTLVIVNRVGLGERYGEWTLAATVSPHPAEARLLPGEGVAQAATHRRRARQELRLGPPLQRSGGRGLPLAAPGNRGRRGRGVGVPGGLRGRPERPRRRGAVPPGSRWRGSTGGSPRSRRSTSSARRGDRPRSGLWGGWRRAPGGGGGGARALRG